MNLYYENHIHEDLQFPIIFHLSRIDKNYAGVPVHWHDSVEILHVVKGDAIFLSDAVKIHAKADETVIINSNNLHSINTQENCDYYYLISDKKFCESFGLFVADTVFQSHITNSFINDCFKNIAQEFDSANDLYRAAIKSQVIRLFVYLYRNYTIDRTVFDKSTVTDRKIDLVKDTILYISNNYQNPISLDLLCGRVGFSKYYFCHMFKEATGQTVIDYLNFIRCSNARLLLASGEYNVTECASLCGFCSPSYFSKQYKKHMGMLPSAAEK